MRKSAFTIAEFVICIMIMFIIMGATISIPFKKAKMTQSIMAKDGTQKCSCLDNPPNNECKITINNPSGRNEFFTIQLLGGGAAGSAYKGGAAGEAKIVHYPTLNGEYLIKLGAGGVYGSSNINGGNTAIYKIDDDGHHELIEFASGGIGSNEKIYTDEIYDTTAVDYTLGEKPSFGTDTETSCGKGGNAGQDGMLGEVIIKW